jgi:hypothetical protein
VLFLLNLILNSSSGTCPSTSSQDPTPSADLSIGNSGSFIAFWNYCCNDNNDDVEDDYS